MEKPILAFLVEDDQDDQLFFKLAVSRYKIPVHYEFAGDGRQAIARLLDESGFSPDIILLDMNMPVMNGIECLTEIRKIQRLNNVPVYMYSTATDNHTVQKCLELGAKGVLQKGDTVAELQEQLHPVFFNDKFKSEF